MAQQRVLEQAGLADASRGTFALESMANVMPCGGLFLARHLKTDKLYSLRQESKRAV